jgi:hypothetical protein
LLHHTLVPHPMSHPDPGASRSGLFVFSSQASQAAHRFFQGRTIESYELKIDMAELLTTYEVTLTPVEELARQMFL